MNSNNRGIAPPWAAALILAALGGGTSCEDPTIRLGSDIQAQHGTGGDESSSYWDSDDTEHGHADIEHRDSEDSDRENMDDTMSSDDDISPCGMCFIQYCACIETVASEMHELQEMETDGPRIQACIDVANACADAQCPMEERPSFEVVDCGWGE